ncbi:hypothetical protein H8S23_07230 [Anaerofilum sp. BX8]|uniref:FtsW/RodA/SpoVE family cell cycle protein n=1 Tax=Anaerofilum hominis TaxID=2763016 RepID=A0A923I6P3_9FIRM|nr:permease prefix domain 1-containing protein [Anaerofilum hominis]MBC5581298.1 hypothetical protein [Anaerofilum hominis]
MLPETLQQWLEQALAQLRCRRAEASVRAELEAHLSEQYGALLARGLPAEEAAAAAAREMGDPVLVGGGLDRVHRPRPAWGQVAAVGALLLAGALLRCAVDREAAGAAVNSAAAWLVVPKGFWGVLLAVAPALLLLVLAARFFDITLLERHTGKLYAVFCVLAVVCFTAGARVGGRFYYGAPLALLFLPLYAALLYRQRGKGIQGLLTGCFGAAPGLAVCLLTPHLEMTVLLGLCCLAVCLWCCAKNWFGLGARASAAAVLAGAALAAVALGILILNGGTLQYYFGRLQAAMDPASDPMGRGYLPLYVDLMHRASVPLGQGLDPAALAAGDVQYPAGFVFSSVFVRDGYQLSYLAWRLGVLPAALLALAVTAVLALLWRAALRTHNALGRMLGIGCAALLSGQYALNLLLNCGLPVSGGFLAFAGSGGAMLCAQALLAGLMLSAFRLDPVVGDPALRRPAVPAPPLPEGARVAYRDGVLSIRFRR